MKLQILIPQWNEGDSVIKLLLDSLLVQQNIDFKEIGVIITNDGSDTILSESLLNSYPFKIEYYRNEHKGVSATRNYCLQKATADYVMFCDADDMFYNACGLYLIFREINGGGFDTFLSYFTEEGRDDNGEPFYIDHLQDATFVHGKVYRREFLVANGIEWNENLTIHEDSYFNYLCQVCSGQGRIKLCQTPFYLWKWRDNSVCRHDKLYLLKTYNNMLDSSDCLIEELLKRGKAGNAAQVAINIIYDSYYNMNKAEWLNQDNQEYRNQVEKRFKKFYIKYKGLSENYPEKERNKIIIQLKNKKFNEGVIMESITFNDWIKEILEKESD